MNKTLENVETNRCQLLDNGYTPLPNSGKACFLKGWNNVQPDEDMINKKWSRLRRFKSTGVRIDNGLCAIDVDIKHPSAEDIIEAMLATLTPEKADALQDHERCGELPKTAFFCRVETPYQYMATGRMTAPGETKDEGAHVVETFGGLFLRQFGAFGPHSFNADGSVAIEYEWPEKSLLDTPLDGLVMLTVAEIGAMVDAARALMIRTGFEPIPGPGGDTMRSPPVKAYDLTEGMEFELHDRSTMSLEKLTQAAESGASGRCSASWLEGPSATNTTRCMWSANSAGHLTVWESASGQTHMAASLKPVDPGEMIKRVAEKMRETADKRDMRPSSGDDLIDVAAKLLRTHAYMPTAKETFVPLWSTIDGEGMTLGNARTAYAPYCGTEIGPRGGEKKYNPIDVWLNNPERIIVAGFRMRPDKPRPTFDEHGHTFINTYAPPELGTAEGGTTYGGEELMLQLIPDERERAWFRQWLAHKWLYPNIPGPAIIMVAKQMGTGRGTLAHLIKLLFGQRYVAAVPFAILAGMNYQSQYTDWGLNSLFAIVNESSAAEGGASEYRAKHQVYEHLKEVVDPAPIERTYIRKGDGSVRAIASTTVMIMTNNKNAIPLPKDDRRFAVLTNGKPRDPAFWTGVHAWMGKQVNIAAFAGWLEETDLSSYDPYAMPLMTNAKEDMHDLNRSPLDNVFDEALESMEGMFVADQMLRKMVEIINRDRVEMPDKWRSIALSLINDRCGVLRKPNGRRYELYHNQRRYTVYNDLGDDGVVTGIKSDVMRDVLVNGDVFGAAEKGHAAHLKLVAGKLRKGAKTPPPEDAK